MERVGVSAQASDAIEKEVVVEIVSLERTLSDSTGGSVSMSDGSIGEFRRKTCARVLVGLYGRCAIVKCLMSIA